MAKGAQWMKFGQKASVVNPPTPSQSEQQVASAEPTTADAKKFGLENFGNTCYANSVIQALYFCGPFRQLVVQANDYSVPPPPNSSSSPQASGTAPVSTSPSSPSPGTSRWKADRKPAYLPTPATPSSSSAMETTLLNGSSTSSQPSIPQQLSPAPNAASPLKPPIPVTPVSIPSRPPTLFSALRSLYVHISTHPSERGTVAPRALIEKLKEVNEEFRSTTLHQDAHEFLNFLLNRIVEEIETERRAAHQLKERDAMVNGDDLSSSITTLSPTIVTTTSNTNSGTSPQDATLVHKLFEGVLTSETRCLTCETVSSRDESFLDLSIDIEQNSSVTSCLRQFSASEMLCQKNKFFCDACCDLQEAEKRMKIKRLPNVLALHLKRFKQDLQRSVKLAYRVAFPFELRLFNTVDDAEDADRLYELFAIVVHIGNGPHHGHYISIVKTLGSWLMFDDVNVSPIAETEIPKYFGDPAGASSPNSGTAYVLYYQAKDIDLVGLGLKEPDLEPQQSISASHSEIAVNGLGVSLNGSSVSGGSSEETPIVPPGLSPGGISPSADVSSDLSVPRPPSINADVPVDHPHHRPRIVGLMDTMMRRTGSHSGHGHKSRPSLSERPSRPLSGVVSDELHAEGYENGSDGNEKDHGTKEPGKKTSWFKKRKSFRLGDKDKERNGHGHGVSASEYASHSNEHDSSGSPWNRFNTAGHHTSKPRIPSEPVGLFDHVGLGFSHGHAHPNGHIPKGDHNGPSAESSNVDPSKSFKVIRSKATNGTSLAMTELNGDATNGYDSGVSTSSSHKSAPNLLPPPLSSSQSMDPQLLSRQSRRPLPAVPSKSPDHKKSLSSLPSVKSDMRGLPPPPRPATAGNDSPSKAPPLPPVPSPTLPAQYLNQLHPPKGDDFLHPDSPRKGNGPDSEDGSRASMATEGSAILSTPDVALAPAVSGTSTASSNLKRATRKLSLTAPMLFGKKDKDKDDRHREKASKKAQDPTFSIVSPRI
ncbi:hypothetical protein ONZ45_g451 [Pleurotus djamor]|nr:hypothetical protein ONZ45_g451 [Pleurotus djamor]